jgi:arginyl-tRNA synthetase
MYINGIGRTKFGKLSKSLIELAYEAMFNAIDDSPLNITDIDDKIIKRAQELKVAFSDLTKEYIAKYYKDLESIGIAKADKEPRATMHVKDMVKGISSLIDKGYAYEVDGDVYFKVRKFTDYGKLSGQSIEAMLEAVRVVSLRNHVFVTTIAEPIHCPGLHAFAG